MLLCCCAGFSCLLNDSMAMWVESVCVNAGVCVFVYDFIEKCDESECVNYRIYMCGDWNVKPSNLSPCICFPSCNDWSFCSFPYS
jgi:hypothetical protein